jgi:hypothetical protein
MRQGMRIIAPDGELRGWPAGVSENRVVTPIPAPGAGYAAFIELVFMAAPPPVFAL